MNKLNHLMDKCCSKDLGILIMRVVVGIIFIYAGYIKFTSIDQTTAFFSAVGLSSFWVYIIATLEFVGGVLMLAGVWVRYAGFVLAGIMAGAIWFATSSMGFAATQFPLSLLATSLGLAMTGAGKWSLESKVFSNKCDNCDTCVGGVCSSHEM